MPEDLYQEARAAIDRGEADRAREIIARAYEANPSDEAVRELYAALHLAHAIRLAAQAREARRQDIARRKIPYDVEFEDTPEVARAFDEALAAHDAVLRAEPTHEKALIMKATLLFRRDRHGGREEALRILRDLQEAHPDHRQVAFAFRKIEKACERCGDTGFCPYCRGRGSKPLLTIERRCERCHGQGICPACGVL